MENLLLNDGKLYTVDGYDSLKDLIRDYMGEDAYRYLNSLEEKLDTSDVRHEVVCLGYDIENALDRLENLSLLLKDLGI